MTGGGDAAGLDLTPAVAVDVGHHAIHTDVQAGWGGLGGGGGRVGLLGSLDLLLLVRDGRLPQRLGGFTRTVGADRNQTQALEYLSCLSKRVLGGAEQGKQLTQPVAQAACFSAVVLAD